LESNQIASNGTFTYLVEEPTITSVIPGTIPQGGGLVRILGQNFTAPVVVTIDTDTNTQGGSPARAVLVNSVTATEINTSFPQLPDSDLQAIPCDDNGDLFQGERFVITAAQITLTDDTGCVADFLVNVQPANTTCRNDIAPTPTPQPTATPLPTPTPTP
jgi:hypothetical protein